MKKLTTILFEFGNLKTPPDNFSINGLINIACNNWTDTGFPGRQITKHLFILPTAIGLPGFIAAFQKNIFPKPDNELIKWSSSPTDAPPAVIKILYFLEDLRRLALTVLKLSLRLPQYFFSIKLL